MTPHRNRCMPNAEPDWASIAKFAGWLLAAALFLSPIIVSGLLVWQGQ